MQADSKMKLYLKESELRPHITLQTIIDVSTGTNLIIKEAYKSLSGKGPKEKTPELKIYASDFRSGSFIEFLSAEIINDPNKPIQLGLAALSNFTPQQIFETAKNAIEFWKIYSELKKSNKNVTVNITNSPGAIVNINGSISIDKYSFDTAVNIPKHGEHLMKPFKRNELSTLEFSGDSKTLALSANDEDCFETPVDTDDETKTIVGDVIEFNKNKKTGRITYSDNTFEVTRKFTLPSNANVTTAIDSMKYSRCSMVCHEQYIMGPDDRRVILGLHAISITLVSSKNSIVKRNDETL